MKLAPSIRASLPALLALTIPTLAAAQVAKGGATIEKPEKVEPAASRATTVELGRPLYAVRKLQVIAVREDARGLPTLRIDVHLADDSALAFDEIAEAVESIEIGKGSAGGKTKYFAIEGETAPAGAGELPKVLEIDVPLGHEAFTVFDPEREYTLVVSRYFLGAAEEIEKDQAKVVPIRIVNRLEEVRCWYLLPGAGVVICHAGPDLFSRTEMIRLEAIEGAHDPDLEGIGSATLGKAELHGLPQATGVSVGMEPGAMMSLSLQLILLGPG